MRKSDNSSLISRMPRPNDEPARDAGRRRQLLGLMLKHQRQAWRRGERAPVETYLAQQPELKADAQAVLDLIYNEIVLREEAGESPQLEDYLPRFPELAAELRLQFEVERAIQQRVVRDRRGPL